MLVLAVLSAESNRLIGAIVVLREREAIDADGAGAGREAGEDVARPAADVEDAEARSREDVAEQRGD